MEEKRHGGVTGDVGFLWVVRAGQDQARRTRLLSLLYLEERLDGVAVLPVAVDEELLEQIDGPQLREDVGALRGEHDVLGRFPHVLRDDVGRRRLQPVLVNAGRDVHLHFETLQFEHASDRRESYFRHGQHGSVQRNRRVRLHEGGREWEEVVA